MIAMTADDYKGEGLCPGMAHPTCVFKYDGRLWEIIESNGGSFKAKDGRANIKEFKYKDGRNGWVIVDRVWSPAIAHLTPKPKI